MTSVALVVTGRLELRGLAGALRRLFPGIDFFIPNTLVETELRDSTSVRVDPARNASNAIEGKIPVIDELIADLAGTLCGRDAAAFSVRVEDLELVNRGNARLPEVIR